MQVSPQALEMTPSSLTRISTWPACMSVPVTGGNHSVICSRTSGPVTRHSAGGSWACCELLVWS